MFNKKNIFTLALSVTFAGLSIQAATDPVAAVTMCGQCVATRACKYVGGLFKQYPVAAHAVAISAVAVAAILLAKNCCCKKKSCASMS